MAALYKAIVEPTMIIGDRAASTVTPLKGNIASAKKFRRSSMLKQAAALRSPTPMLTSLLGPAKQGVAMVVPQATTSASSRSMALVVPQATTSAVSMFAIPGRAEGMPPPSRPPQKPAGVEGGGKRLVKKTTRPPVPAFTAPPVEKQRHPLELLRLTAPLSPKKEDDNYEISEKDENSDAECEEPDRTGKHVPRWCSDYLQTLTSQSTWDPDGIFGNKVPRCDLEAIFSNEIYKKYSRERPQRRRGSSGEWKKDRLRPNEIRDYKRKMGQTKAWEKAFNASLKNANAPAGATLAAGA